MPCFGPKKEPKSSLPELTDEELLNAVIADLIKRKEAKPRTSQKLRSSIHARCGKEISASRIEAVYETLLKRGYVKEDGTKVAYGLSLKS
jgi:hypothetical protein